MGLTGLIFAAIAGGWIAFLVPWFLKHRDQTIAAPDDDAIDRFAESMQVIRRGSDPFADLNDPELQISTPLQRAAIRRECSRVAATAARRRRLGLFAHLGVLVVLVVLTFVLQLPWWTSLIGLGLLIGFLVLSRVSVITVGQMLDAKLALANSGWDDEPTVTLDLSQFAPDPVEEERSVELSLPIAQLGSLWEPIPVTPPNYVSKPLVPRSVRTIDLSSPVAPASTPKLPVIAERPDDLDGEPTRPIVLFADDEFADQELPRAVGQ